jgi:hypothetical protein
VIDVLGATFAEQGLEHGIDQHAAVEDVDEPAHSVVTTGMVI